MTGVSVFCGLFASQPLVFAHLLDAADQHGLAIDLDHVEVIQGNPIKRLAHVFRPEDTARIEADRGQDNTLVLIFPEALIPGARLFDTTALLRRTGVFPAVRKRTLSR